MSAPGDHAPDHTVEIPPASSLADDLLAPTETVPVGTDPGPDADSSPAAVDEPADSDPDDYLDFGDHKRSRVTTGLIIALIFAVGVLFGTLLARALAPTPQPQIIYVLNDPGGTNTPHPTVSPAASPR